MASRQPSSHFIVTYSSQAHRSDASALRAVGIATKLTRSDLRFEISGDRLCCAGENAFRGIGGGCRHLIDDNIVHVELREERPKTAQFLYDSDALQR